MNFARRPDGSRKRAPDRKTRGVRWSVELECFEARCPDCFRKRGTIAYDGYWWPLTQEFWNTVTMQRCRACEAERNRVARREAYSNNRPYELARQREYDSLYRQSRKKEAA